MAVGAAAGAAITCPGEQSQASSRSPSNPSSPRIIRLDTNVNPYGPSPKVLGVIEENLQSISDYPDVEYGPLVEQIARFHKLDSSHITLGCGSREILRIAAAACLSSGRRLVLASPTFDPMACVAKQVGAEIVAVPITRHFGHDLDAMLHQVNASTGLIYICNPHNPTGSLTPRKDLEAFLQKLPLNVTVLIDEAYHEYVGPTSDYVSFIDDPVADNRLIVVRSFSKIYGLAGLRLGFAVSSEKVAVKLGAIRLERGINVVAARAALAALDDPDYIQLSFKRNVDSRQEFYNQTMARMLRQIDSKTNFVFMRMGLSSAQVIDHFKRNNILLGPAVSQMDRYVRVAIGRLEDMREFWRVWDMQPSAHTM